MQWLPFSEMSTHPQGITSIAAGRLNCALSARPSAWVLVTAAPGGQVLLCLPATVLTKLAIPLKGHSNKAVSCPRSQLVFGFSCVRLHVLIDTFLGRRMS